MSTSESGTIPPYSLAEAQRGLQIGAFTAVQLCEALLARIRTHNGRIRAVRTLFEEEALRDAAEVDRLRQAGERLGALAGIPWLVKENIDVLPGPVSAGLDFLDARVPAGEAWIVQRLREAGAVILGTTVSDPGAFGVRTEHVRHPVDPVLTVGGSSGGSAAALLAGFAYGALGTDTGGSIRIPSACCGTAGLKPTFGTWSTEGVYPLVRDLDHVGPMARTVDDLHAIWDALLPATLDHAGSSGALRLGWSQEWLDCAQPNVQVEFHRSLAHLASLGHQVVKVQLPSFEDVARAHFGHFCHEVVQLHLMEFGHAPQMFGMEAQEAFRAGRALDSGELRQVEDIRKRLSASVDEALGVADLLVLPTLPVHRPEVTAESFQVGGRSMGFTASLVHFTSLFNHTGHPVLATPSPGIDPSRLHGAQWVGPNGCEGALLDAVRHVLGAPAGNADDIGRCAGFTSLRRPQGFQAAIRVGRAV
jgi:Asp-tRNA(Asn)/Glu-tRNA(Gln) amidotransferase A subunit family amidase